MSGELRGRAVGTLRVRANEFARKRSRTEYGILDPVAQTAEFYLRNPVTLKYVAQSPDANGNYESAVIPGFWLTVAWLWQTPLPTLRGVVAVWAAGKP